MPKRSSMKIEHVIEIAEEAAASAAAEAMGPEFKDRWDCGDAVVVVPGRYRKLVQHLKGKGIDSQPSREGHWFSICPGLSEYQGRRPIEAACRAYADVLRAHGFERVHSHSWAD